MVLEERGIGIYYMSLGMLEIYLFRTLLLHINLL